MCLTSNAVQAEQAASIDGTLPPYGSIGANAQKLTWFLFGTEQTNERVALKNPRQGAEKTSRTNPRQGVNLEHSSTSPRQGVKHLVGATAHAPSNPRKGAKLLEKTVAIERCSSIPRKGVKLGLLEGTKHFMRQVFMLYFMIELASAYGCCPHCNTKLLFKENLEDPNDTFLGRLVIKNQANLAEVELIAKAEAYPAASAPAMPERGHSHSAEGVTAGRGQTMPGRSPAPGVLTPSSQANMAFKELSAKLSRDERIQQHKDVARAMELANAQTSGWRFKHKKHERFVCPTCGKFVFVQKENLKKLNKPDGEESGDKLVKSHFIDQYKSIAIGLGAILAGIGMGNYSLALRWSDQSVAQSGWGHLCFFLGIGFLTYLLFKGQGWKHGEDTWVKVAGAFTFVGGSIFVVAALGTINPNAIAVTDEKAAELVSDIQWKDLLDGGNATPAVIFGIGVSFLILSLIFALVVNLRGPKFRALDWVNGAFSAVGLISVVVAGALTADVMTRSNHIEELIPLKEIYNFDTQEAGFQDHVIGADSFVTWGLAMCFSFMYIMWLVVNSVWKGDGGAKLKSRKIASVVAVVAAGLTGAVGVATMRYSHHHFVNEHIEAYADALAKAPTDGSTLGADGATWTAETAATKSSTVSDLTEVLPDGYTAVLLIAVLFLLLTVGCALYAKWGHKCH